MSAKHTPGPWTIEGWEGEPFIVGPEVHYVNHGDPAVICKVLRYGGTRPTEANARLIAAAPDLLEAARLTELCVMHLPARLGETNWPYIAERLRAAIAKAEVGL